jgi:hypothetical protein
MTITAADIAKTLRELAAMYWREGNILQASALHAQALKLEAGVRT